MKRYSQIIATVVHGRQLGRKIGFPTANVELPHSYDGEFGVFFARVKIDEKDFDAVLSIGRRPTIAENQTPNAECYILDFEGDIYGKQIIVTPLQYIRPEQRFGDVEQLRSQIENDVREARKIQQKLKINNKPF